jgi:eukaryotic-like serine/threonine-protein kinase
MTATAAKDEAQIIGRYALHGEIASGGMAVVHFGRLLGPVGFSRPVAIKRLHAQLAREPNVRAMFIDEARLASRIRHPNVVPTLDVVTHGDDLLLVMEYVHGEPLQQLMRGMRQRGERIPLRITLAIMASVLHGLHAAHEATTETGQPLNVVHRDVSPQNVIVGVDGVARVLDFGIARATVRLENTREGIVKGKLAYMAPEQLGAEPIDRRTDVYAAGVVLWEAITQRPLFDGDSEAAIIASVLRQEILPPSSLIPGIPDGLDDVVLRALAPDKEHRFQTAHEMATALAAIVPPANDATVAAWVDEIVGPELRERQAMVTSALKLTPVTDADAKEASEVVFFTTGGAHQRPRPPSRLDKLLAPLEKQFTEMVEGLPENIRRPVHAARWWIVGVIVTMLVTLVYVGISPTRQQPEGGVSGAAPIR